ncbi:MAG TPA: hemolysin III family protein [Phycicoccus sp.]|jgi:hemolysin III|nr:hemolysin III family protein [Phycicoccus sp.]HQH07834.1 hemolysin III family protein [Phycicoccus sp.]HQK32977.1 hemolysin III family protein [Phycicoccus sp.]HQY96565.1 hemolysin III family protein [Phycicoccus sp.]HRA44287.1 hemolysin III family protein [Phycicoccus sp.]
MTTREPESDPGRLRDAREALEERVDAVLEVIKPHLRGWLHLGMAPLAFLAGMTLVVLSDSLAARISAAVFTLTAVLLFGTSAIYHRGTWGPKMTGFLKRFDHANIFLIIAGTYTPFALLLSPSEGRTMLLIVWLGALAGVLFRILWVDAPRWLYVPVYVALGWVAIFYLEPLFERGGAALVTFIGIGGLLYTAGAVVYGIKRPNPSPRWFGFHEIFHTLTILAFTAHFVAASIALHRVAA